MPKSPRITHLSWGCIETGDGERYQDAKIWPGGGREWNWQETGTEHTPGIQPDDVEELLENGAEIVVLSMGYHERLGVCDETVQMLENRGVPVHVLQTEQAVIKFNQLREKNEPVGGLFHSAC